MEDSSEKRKRGRPRKHPDELIRDVLKTRDAKTERGAVEHLLYSETACLILEAWEADPVGKAWAEYYMGKDIKNYCFRHKSIMAALGRIEDEEARLETARIIAEKKLSTRYAVAAIRRVRLGQEDKPDYLGLLRYIETALNAYVEKHPSTTGADLIRALRDVADVYEEEITS